uniref:Pentatricopeptide repeat-containing protein At5g08510 n=1 Tax=Rhizophora mucronata TaxID=61149 RepID=A0A2P2N2S4_RHIMU
MNKLKQIHAFTLRNGIDHDTNLVLEILEIPNIPYAHKLFNLIPKPSVFLYNKLIQAYSSQNQTRQCIFLYSQMCLRNCPQNEHTFTALFAACPSLSSPLHGQLIHAQFVKSGFQFDVFPSTALVDMYGKLGMLVSARKVFDEMSVKDTPTWNSMIAGYSRRGDMEEALNLFRLMPYRNVISWTAIISGYSQNGQHARALEMFLKMEKERAVRPNEVTIASVLPACANLGTLEVGERLEAYARENGLSRNMYVSNALLEMYARCGEIDIAKRVFDEIGKRKNVCSWNSMIMGLAVHGRSHEALQLFDQMLNEGHAPDDVTFVGLLLACTHGGMVKKGRKLFEAMQTSCCIIPKLEHYGCMVDLLGRTGELQEAYNLIKSMPMKADSVIWGTLLGACSFHSNIEFGEIAAEHLFELEPWNPGNYVILSNIYASAGRWDGVTRLRKFMKGSQITKAAGYSFIEDRGKIHKFIVEDSSHPRCDEIYRILNEITTKMKLIRTLGDFESELEELSMMEKI